MQYLQLGLYKGILEGARKQNLPFLNLPIAADYVRQVWRGGRGEE